MPWAPDAQVVYEHLHRYLWAARLVSGRRVLDLGSGEGFGAAILSETAEDVVGLDIDPKTVEHSELNYARRGLSFKLGSATDLSSFEAGTFGAVVAFETIEHVAEQERVLDEISRVLSDDGLLVISTPDRRPYTEATGTNNQFHVRELSAAEFSSLLGERFPHLAIWGQRTISGSHIASLDAEPDRMTASSVDFYVERAGDDWRLAPDPSPMYLLAVASRSPLSEVAALSTLADPELELVRVQERLLAQVRAGAEAEIKGLSELATARETARATAQAELEAAIRERQSTVDELQRRIAALEQQVAQSHAEVAAVSHHLAATQGELASSRSELAVVRQANLRYERSVTFQLFRRMSEALYRVIGGRQSFIARGLQSSLRRLGRKVVQPAVTESGGTTETLPREDSAAPPGMPAAAPRDGVGA